MYDFNSLKFRDIVNRDTAINIPRKYFLDKSFSYLALILGW